MCLPFLASAAQIVKLHGNIRNPVNDSISVSYYPEGISDDKKVIATALSKDGSFALSIPVTQKFTELTIQYGKQETELYVGQDANLEMTVDAKDFKQSLHYSGKGEEIANFMAKHVLEKGFLKYYESRLPTASDEIPQFEAAIKAVEANELNFLKTNGALLPKDFSAYFETYIVYTKYNVMLQYPATRTLMKQGYLEKNIPQEYYAVLKNVPAAFNDNFVGLDPYIRYATDYFKVKLGAEGFKNMADDPARKSQATDSAYKLMYRQLPAKTAEVVIGRDIYLHLKYRSIPEAKKMLVAYKKHFPKSKNIKLIYDQLDQIVPVQLYQP